MNEPKININVMPGAQMNGYVKEQHNYFGTIQNIEHRKAEPTPAVNQGEKDNASMVNDDVCNNPPRQDEELCMFIHPAVDSDEEQRKIHNEIKRLVKRQGLQDICRYLLQMKKDNKVLLPPSPSVAYAELVRMGMPDGEGFNENTFRKYYLTK